MAASIRGAGVTVRLWSKFLTCRRARPREGGVAVILYGLYDIAIEGKAAP